MEESPQERIGLGVAPEPAGDCGMLGWLRERPARARLIAERIEEGVRELGVLFLAFAPLGAVLSGRPFQDYRWALLIFIALGLLFFGVALLSEWRRGDDH